MSESRILAETIDALNMRYHPVGLFWRNNSGAVKIGPRLVKFGLPGSADILGCYRGRLVAIETKTETGRQSTAQRNFQIAVEAAGGVYLLVRSAAAALQEVGKL